MPSSPTDSCSSCGRPALTKGTACLYCGKAIAPEGEHAAPQVPTTEDANMDILTGKGALRCPACKVKPAQFEIDAGICDVCGKPLVRQEEPKKTPHREMDTAGDERKGSFGIGRVVMIALGLILCIYFGIQLIRDWQQLNRAKESRKDLERQIHEVFEQKK